MCERTAFCSCVILTGIIIGFFITSIHPSIQYKVYNIKQCCHNLSAQELGLYQALGDCMLYNTAWCCIECIVLMDVLEVRKTEFFRGIILNELVNITYTVWEQKAVRSHVYWFTLQTFGVLDCNCRMTVCNWVPVYLLTFQNYSN